MISKIQSRLEAVGLAALLIGIAGCSTPDRSGSQVMNDRQTAHRVKKELNNAPTYKYPDVGVTAFNGSVQLTGFAENEAQRESAAEVASNVKGVKQVINQIMLKGSPTGRTIIRDPLGNDAERVLLDTNSPPVQLPTPTIEQVPNP